MRPVGIRHPFLWIAQVLAFAALPQQRAVREQFAACEIRTAPQTVHAFPTQTMLAMGVGLHQVLSLVLLYRPLLFF